MYMHIERAILVTVYPQNNLSQIYKLSINAIDGMKWNIYAFKHKHGLNILKCCMEGWPEINQEKKEQKRRE